MEKIINIFKYYRLHIHLEDTTSLSYYLILSLIPALTVLAFLAQRLQIDITVVSDYIYSIFTPEIGTIIKSALFDSRVNYLSIVAIGISIFVCSKGIYRLIRKVNELYHYQNAPYFKLRVHALIDTFLLFVLMLGMIVIVGIVPVIDNFLHLNIVYLLKYAGGFIFLFCMLLIVFYLVPTQKVKLKDIWGGALVSTILFVLIIFGINLYLNFVNYKNIYGSFASIAVLLLTCDFFAKGLYLGFVINALRNM